MRGMVVRCLVSTWVIAAACGCARQVEPLVASDVVGRWTISTKAVDVLKRRGFERMERVEHAVVLHANGECAFRSYWAFIDRKPSADTENDYVLGSRSCRWTSSSERTRTVDARAVIGRIEIDIEWPRDLDTVEPRFASTAFDVERRADGLVLVAMFGDAPGGRVDFVREP